MNGSKEKKDKGSALVIFKTIRSSCNATNWTCYRVLYTEKYRAVNELWRGVARKPILVSSRYSLNVLIGTLDIETCFRPNWCFTNTVKILTVAGKICGSPLNLWGTCDNFYDQKEKKDTATGTKSCGSRL